VMPKCGVTTSGSACHALCAKIPLSMLGSGGRQNARVVNVTSIQQHDYLISPHIPAGAPAMTQSHSILGIACNQRRRQSYYDTATEPRMAGTKTTLERCWCWKGAAYACVRQDRSPANAGVSVVCTQRIARSFPNTTTAPAVVCASHPWVVACRSRDGVAVGCTLCPECCVIGVIAGATPPVYEEI